ncbi:fibronectin type III domain protein [Fusarium subglutinans]|uniref:Fibronectin type III domain protein n=1 Tax=Gibberella subglutinans TaxID=42677 RepID=A0A8H5P1A4_GIBSU|nr:fibronectin type III domain protein [Fusarium subglutinans]KAF5586149.1 fibronectin type III domain protein [Fusarium subglutinans]
MILPSLSNIREAPEDYGLQVYEQSFSLQSPSRAIQDRACARYDHVYPYLVNQHSQIGDESGRKSQFLSCSGAVTTDVVEKQIPRLDNNQEVITLSIESADDGAVERSMLQGEMSAQLDFFADDRVGDSVKFINCDQFIGKYGGRYCEAGVDDPTTESDTRKSRMFYELNTWDPLGSSPWKRGAEGGELNGTFYGDMLVLSQITRLVNPNAELRHYGDDVKKALAARVAILDYLIPDGYGRFFHPQIPLHEMIASLVTYEIMKDHQARIGYAVWTHPPENTSYKVKPSPTHSHENTYKKDQPDGNCWGKSDGIGCSVFLEGEGCKMKGHDMWDWYQKIRKDGEKSKKCGEVGYEDGCTLKIDFVTGCNNHG